MPTSDRKFMITLPFGQDDIFDMVAGLFVAHVHELYMKLQEVAAEQDPSLPDPLPRHLKEVLITQAVQDTVR